jgi:hypothetical protein
MFSVIAGPFVNARHAVASPAPTGGEWPSDVAHTLKSFTPRR